MSLCRRQAAFDTSSGSLIQVAEIDESEDIDRKWFDYAKQVLPREFLKYSLK